MTVNPQATGNPFIDNNKANQVSQYHTNADTDSGQEAIHHTLGIGPGQAANGYQVQMALDATAQNLETINELIVELQQAQADLIEQTAILDKVGKRIEYLSTLTGTVPNAAAAPYTALTGYDVEEGDTAPEVGVEYSGSGVFTCLESGSYNFECGINWAANANNRRVLFVNLNSTASGSNSYYRFTVSPVNSAVYLQWHKWDMKLVAGDVLRFAVFQDSGGALGRSTADGIQRPSGSYSSVVGITRILGQL